MASVDDSLCQHLTMDMDRWAVAAVIMSLIEKHG
jgi:hypothetical protein